MSDRCRVNRKDFNELLAAIDRLANCLPLTGQETYAALAELMTIRQRFNKESDADLHV